MEDGLNDGGNHGVEIPELTAQQDVVEQPARVIDNVLLL